MSQLMLVQKPLPSAENLVALLSNIPSTLAAIQASVPQGVIAYTRQVCRGTYCIACDGSASCVKRVWVGVGQQSDGKYSFNVTSVPADSILYFVTTRPGMCVPYINLPSEYQTDTTAAVSSISTITTIQLTCLTDSI
ncbi:hypothetical protein JZU54_01490, partial [bacterium]|nr:hypothetical protein [bacterium]